MGVGGSGWEQIGVGGSEWEWMEVVGVSGSGWQWVGVGVSGWQWVGVGVGGWKCHDLIQLLINYILKPNKTPWNNIKEKTMGFLTQA